MRLAVLCLVVALALALGLFGAIQIADSGEASPGSVVRTSYKANVRAGYDDTIRVVHVPADGREITCVISDFVGTIAMDCGFPEAS